MATEARAITIPNDGLDALLPYQARWNRETAPVAVMEKSRRIGLSWGDACERVVYAAEGRGNVYYQSYAQDMTEGYISDCAAWARKLGQAASEILQETVLDNERKILIYRIDFASGKHIKALSSHARSVRSKGAPGDILIIDEAAYCDDIGALIKAGVAFTMWGGQVRIISTHNGADNEFNELIQEIRAGRHEYALHRVTLDDAIKDGLARRICSVRRDTWNEDYEARFRKATIGQYRSKDEADEELFCVPRLGGGAYFPRALIEVCMFDAPVIRFSGSAAYNALPEPARAREMADWLADTVRPLLVSLNPGRRHVYGMDFGRTGDLSVIAPLEIGEQLQRTCPFLLELQNVPHQQQVQVVECIGQYLPRFSGGAHDAGGNGSYVAEAAVDLFGSMIEPVVFSEAWYREEMPKYKALYEDRGIRIPRHDDVLQDHRAIQLIRGVPKLPPNKTDKKGERHGDSAIALALAAYAAAHSRDAFDFEVAEKSISGTMPDHFIGLDQVGIYRDSHNNFMGPMR